MTFLILTFGPQVMLKLLFSTSWFALQVFGEADVFSLSATSPSDLLWLLPGAFSVVVSVSLIADEVCFGITHEESLEFTAEEK